MSPEAYRWCALSLPLVLGCGLAACPSETPTKPAPIPSSSLPSPNASILPAPLKPITVVDPGSTTSADASLDTARPPPEILREDVPLTADPRPLIDPRGTTLVARFVWRGLPPPPAGPNINGAALLAARAKTQRSLTIDIAPIGRMRIRIETPVFPIPPRTELRARVDRFGHVLVWPDGGSYRVLQPGTLRALFQEGRADVGLLVVPQVELGESSRLLGYETTTHVVTTPLGTATLFQAAVPEVAAGDLLCRTLLELVAAQPSTPVCAPSLVPLRVEYEWESEGRLNFEVQSLQRTAVLEPDHLLVPPRSPSFKGDRLPRPSRAGLLAAEELRAFRKRDAPLEGLDGGVEEVGLLAVNQAETIRYLIVDGVPIARVPARSERRILSLREGRYSVGWIDFLGATPEPPRPQRVPSRVEVGGMVDAGVPEP